MFAWLQANLGSIVVVLFLIAVVALIVRRLILDKRAGKHICGGSCGSCGGSCGSCGGSCGSCGGGCGGCPMQGKCHGK